ncbi:uncharacterized protein DUF5300 [Anaerobacterium chartisolvens]|uniref:Uncharacterized protein DUF5300 n=1 Tax=Anaerobacterium chartisolvens TaxID=1297424 RepID=A0A369AXC1_9FIRM|nr:DUF5301 domain-containing protein [Anaerobacterium chartisolvens]RCX12988.1 uncharacterized protein DUF5300 [Anaerobacterium chartisolvens]
MDKLICQILKRNILNHKKPALWVITVVVIACTAAAVFLLANPVKMLELPDAASVLSMDMEQFNEYESLGAVTATDKGDIKSVLSALTGARKTLRSSVNDYPVQNSYLVIRLNLSEERRTLCLYSEGSAYYIEEPYIGVYRSSSDANAAIHKIYTDFTRYSMAENPKGGGTPWGEERHGGRSLLGTFLKKSATSFVE